MTETVEQIAARITKLQRYVVLHMGGEYPQPSPPFNNQRELKAMEGLLWTRPPRELLPLGLAVRKFIQEQGS